MRAVRIGTAARAGCARVRGALARASHRSTPRTTATTLSILLLFVVGCGGVERPKTTYQDLIKECTQLHGGLKAVKNERVGSNSRKYTVTCRDGSVIKATEGDIP